MRGRFCSWKPREGRSEMGLPQFSTSTSCPAPGAAQCPQSCSWATTCQPKVHFSYGLQSVFPAVFCLRPQVPPSPSPLNERSTDPKSGAQRAPPHSCRRGMDVLSCFEAQVGNLGSQGGLVLLKCDLLQGKGRPGPSLPNGRGPGRTVGVFFGARREQRPHSRPVPVLCDSQGPPCSLEKKR